MIEIDRIEQRLMLEDPRFADGMRTGAPCSPREYRRRRWLVLAVLLAAVAVSVTVAVLWGAAYIVPIAVLTAPTELVVWVVASPR
jgi:Protein of unknown function (DUF3040)